jgi:hypothetical protein
LRALKHALLAALGGTLMVASAAAAQSPDEVRAIIREAAATHGANPATLLAIVRCETGGRWNADALGDSGHSHGIAQINDARTGLLSHFLAQGYSSPYNVAEAADYLARVAVGTWAGQGVTLRRWSCFGH